MTDMTLRYLSIPPGDLPLCGIGFTLLKAELKKAHKCFAALGQDVTPLQQMEAAQEEIAQRLMAAEADADLPLPVHLARALRLGIALELDRVASLRERQGDLLISDQHTTQRLAQLNGLLAVLDDQITMTLSSR